MSTTVTKFEEAKLPTFFRAPEESKTNTLAALASVTFPYLSIKGKRFAVVRNKEETTIMRVDDDETPANAIEAVLVNAASNYSKVFYASGYVEGSKDKPTCFSDNGIAPDPQATDKQSSACMTCEHNAWGTGTNGKGKACSDSLRLAISFPDSINDPMLLRVPPASLKAVTEYAAFLARKGAPMEGLVTKIKFDSEEATPKLQFSALRYLTEDQYKETLVVAKARISQQIIGVSFTPAPKSGTPQQLEAPEKTEEVHQEEVKPAKKVEVKIDKAPKNNGKTGASVSVLAAKLKKSMSSAAADD